MNIETLQAAERVSAWYRNRRLITSVASHVVTDAANDESPDDESAEEHPQGCSSELSSTGVAALLRKAHSTPATSKTTPAKVSA